MASFYIPMSLSYASNLGHIPPINGLYSFVFNPLIYALLGTCPQMVVGPEAAGSLLVGTVVRTSVDRGHSSDDNGVLNAQIAGVVTTTAGAVIFIAGLTRLGFLDSVLSRPFLRGFISAIGFVILVDQLIPELGLTRLEHHTAGVEHGSSVTKLVFLVQNISQTHGLTAAVSIGSFAIIMTCRSLKRHLQPRYPSVAYVPDRFIVVVLSAILCWKFEWDKAGLSILGNAKAADGTPFPFHFPFRFSHIKHIDTALSTSFLIALLGFFESSVAAKSLGEGTHDLRGVTLSANRELVALGVANLVGGCFMALPAFGGYGRSKVNASTGGTTPMSSILLSIITLLCVLFLLPYFYYLPKGVLSAMISVVAYSLIEECPHDICFFLRIRGWTELSLMLVIFLATIFYSLSLGIALGIGLSILALIKHSTKPRIQILGKVPGTIDKFENAELNPGSLEFIEGCLIVKIPEPLTFANTGELKTRLRRLEYYGTDSAHPALPRVRAEEHNKNLIFDVHGVTSIDGSGTQVLTEIVEAYVKKGVRVFFCRLPTKRSQVFKKFQNSRIVDLCGGSSHFVASVEEALRLTELEELDEDWRYRDDRTTVPAIHFTLTRRGGPLASHAAVNFTNLLGRVEKAEKRYLRHRREFQGNKLLRQRRPELYGMVDDNALTADLGHTGTWFAKLELGDPPQRLEAELDMLSPDYYMMSTSSSSTIGSKYDAFASRSHTGLHVRVHPECELVTDLFVLPLNSSVSTSANIPIPLCQPPRYSRRTLRLSGSQIGLSQQGALAQIDHHSFIDHLLQQSIIAERVWSITLLDSQSGILTLGSTIVSEIEEAKIRTQVELHNIANPGADRDFIEKEVQSRLAILKPNDWHDLFRWSEVSGAAGWWTTLLQGVWIDGVKILRNQPAVFDVQAPFILAPPIAARRFYESISGAKRLKEPYDMFYAFPCHNPPAIALEFNAWMFAAMTSPVGKEEAPNGPPGGRFSLGKEREGSGFCVGAVVETRVAYHDAGKKDGDTQQGRQGDGGDGLRNLWIIGEPYFYGNGLVFDLEAKRVGFRSY
ncbi:MAG: hypothetical protein Q9227_009239 [Pyrenula ochraceoflavens]